MKKNSLKAILSVLLVMLLLSVFGANTALAVAVPSRYTEMKVDDTYYITIGRGEEAYVKFTPKASGTYVLESSCLNDVKVVIYDAAMTVLGSDDNGKDEENFRIVCNLTGGTTYYYGITFAQATRYGQCPVTLTCRGTDCAHAHYKETADSGPTCHFDGYTAGKWCEDCEYWFEGHVKIEGGHKDENNDDVCERCRGEMPYQTNLCGPIEQPHLVKYERYADQSIVIFGTGEMKTGAFQGDDLLTKVTILPGVTKVMDNAFYDCDKLTTVILPDTIDDIRHDSFNSCDTLETINIPDSVQFIGYCAFSYCRALKNITIPDTVRGIGLEAFDHCEGLENITLGAGVTKIDQKTFANCTALQKIELSDNVSYIYANAFDGCTKLASVKLGKGVYSVAGEAFKNCTSLSEIHFSAPLYSIGLNAFNGCSSLHTVSLPATLSSVGEGAFYNCNALRTVYYADTADKQATITIAAKNTALTNATWLYQSCMGKTNHDFVNGCDAECDTCGTTRKVEHKYDNKCDNTCNSCGAERVVMGHSYDSGVVTKKATCKATGVMTYTCGICKATKTSVIAKTTTHTYTNACDKTCNVCGATRTVDAHKYTNACDKTCNTCGATRTTSHSYTKKVTKATLTANGKIQNVCKVCGYTASTSTTIYRPYSFKLSATSYTYNGAVKTPSVTVKDSAGKTISSSNYTVTYATGRKNAGTYSVKITMKGNYTGTKTLTFKINPISITKCKLSLSATTYTYDGKTKTPSVVVKNASGTKLTTSSYTVTYATGRKNVGTYKVTIKMKGNYSGTKTLTFKVNPAKTTVSKLTPATKSLKVSITKKSTQVTGYQIQYSTSKTFKSVKTVNISSYKTTSTTIKSLKAKTTYYVRVRTYKTVGGVKYYSGWSTVKYAKTK